MITGEWDVPFLLSTPQGQLPINQQALLNSSPLGYYMLDPSLCSTGTARRVTRTNIAQADGEITHRKFKTGYIMELTMQLWQDPVHELPACGYVLREMIDLLMLHLNSIENADGRIQWTPSANPPLSIPDRMLDKARILGPSGQGQTGFVSVVAQKEAGNEITQLTFALISPYPYALDTPGIVTPLGGSALVTVTNDGNSEVYPVFNVSGATGGFSITNFSNLDEQGNPKKIVYSDTFPGAEAISFTEFAQIECFRNTAYLGILPTSNPADLDNLKPGIDVPNSDFFTLVPGVNHIELVGASGEMLWQPAWA